MTKNGYLVIFWTPEEMKGWEDCDILVRDIAVQAAEEAIDNIKCYLS